MSDIQDEKNTAADSVDVTSVVQEALSVDGGPEPRSVSAGRGMTWLLDGFALFRQAPAMWVLAIILFIVLNVVISLVPVLGAIANSLISPILLAGFMVACRTLENDGDLTFSDLLSGFRQHAGRLAGVGALYLLGVILSVLVGFVLLAMFFNVEALEQAFDAGTMQPEMIGLGMLLPILVILLLIMPLVMGYWFAPALVILHNMRPMEAMVRSFFACLRNILPFTVYGFVLLGLIILACIPAFLGLLVVGPVAIASVYAGYRDIFL